MALDYSGDPGLIPGLKEVYTQNVLKVFLGGPDTIPALLEQIISNVMKYYYTLKVCNTSSS